MSERLATFLAGPLRPARGGVAIPRRAPRTLGGAIGQAGTELTALRPASGMRAAPLQPPSPPSAPSSVISAAAQVTSLKPLADDPVDPAAEVGFHEQEPTTAGPPPSDPARPSSEGEPPMDPTPEPSQAPIPPVRPSITAEEPPASSARRTTPREADSQTDESRHAPPMPRRGEDDRRELGSLQVPTEPPVERMWTPFAPPRARPGATPNAARPVVGARPGVTPTEDSPKPDRRTTTPDAAEAPGSVQSQPAPPGGQHRSKPTIPAPRTAPTSTPTPATAERPRPSRGPAASAAPGVAAPSHRTTQTRPAVAIQVGRVVFRATQSPAAPVAHRAMPRRHSISPELPGSGDAR